MYGGELVSLFGRVTSFLTTLGGCLGTWLTPRWTQPERSSECGRPATAAIFQTRNLAKLTFSRPFQSGTTFRFPTKDVTCDAHIISFVLVTASSRTPSRASNSAIFEIFHVVLVYGIVFCGYFAASCDFIIPRFGSWDLRVAFQLNDVYLLFATIFFFFRRQ